MRAILILLAFGLGALPASAQTPARKWVQAATDGSQFTVCVDQNSIVKRPDGLTQYVYQLLCKGADNTMWVQAVNCDQDMSGPDFPMQGRPFLPSKDGSYTFSSRRTKSCSLAAQTAKFVCKKPGPYLATCI